MRLTEKKENGKYDYATDKNGYCFLQEGQLVNKLGQLEDIEEELGIDLLTYFKIKSAKSVYVKELGKDCSEMLVRPSKDSIDVCYKGFVNIPECDSCLQLKDYGKTWALTREELENETK